MEEFPAEPPFDGVISRAFASLNDMVSWCHHLPAENGHFYALKGLAQEDEMANLPEGVVIKGGCRTACASAGRGASPCGDSAKNDSNFYQKM